MARSQLDDHKWLKDLDFLVDITQKLNTLHLKLQGPGQLVTAAFENVKEFTTKPKVMENPAL